MLSQLTPILLLITTYLTSNAQNAVDRKDLLSVTVGRQSVDNVQVKEIRFSPGNVRPAISTPALSSGM